MSNQLAWLELPVTLHKVNFLFVSTFGAVAGTERKLLTKVLFPKCQHTDGGGRVRGRWRGRFNERGWGTVHEVRRRRMLEGEG